MSDFDAALALFPQQTKAKPQQGAYTRGTTVSAPDVQFNYSGDPAALRAQLPPEVQARFDEMVPGYAPQDQFGPALSLFKSPAQPQPVPPQPKQLPSMREGAGSPTFDVVGNLATSLGSTIAGGYRGIYNTLKALSEGKSFEDATAAGAQAVQQTQQDYTFQPRTSEGQAAINVINSPYNPLNYPAVAGQYLGGKLADAGMPGAGAATEAALTTAPMLLGLRGGRVAVGKLADVGKAPEVVPRVEPTLGLPVDQPPSPVVTPTSTNKVPALLRKAEPAPAAPAAAPVAPAVAPKPPPPTLADATPETQAAVAQAQKSGKPLNEAALQAHIDAGALDVPVQLTKGQALGDPTLISNEMNSRGGKAPPVPPDFYKQQAVALVKNIDALKDRVAPDVVDATPVSLGQQLVDAYKRQDAPIVADIDAKYQALRDAAGGDFPVDAPALVNNIRAALKKELLSEDAPASQWNEIQRLGQEGSMTFEQFLALRRNLGNVARTASDGNTRTAAGLMVNELESLPLQGVAADLKPLADQARAAAKARFQALDADPAYKAAVNDSVAEGEPSALADRFATNYVVNGRHANVLRMRDNLSADPAALQAMGASVVEHLRGAAKAKEAGTFSQDGYNRALNALGPKLDTALGPETAQKARLLGKTAERVQIQPRGSFVNNSNTLVGAMSDAAKKGLRGVLAVKTMGGSEVVKSLADTVKAGKEAKQSVEPGAGITTLRDLPR